MSTLLMSILNHPSWPVFVCVSQSKEEILVFLLKHLIIYLKLLKTLQSQPLFIVANDIILISETLFLVARTF